MSVFAYRDGELHAEDVPLSAIAAQFGTPCYVYSRAAITAAFRDYNAGFADLPHLVCYAMKANSNLAVLKLLADLGSGFDIVSSGELARVLAVGGDPAKVVFSGVGKTQAEMADALNHGILCFNVESEGELERLDAVAAALGKTAPVSFRVNPDVDPKTHPYIATGLAESKFGVAFAEAPALYRRAARMRNIAVHGIDIHIGSQITELSPYREAAAKVLDLVDRLRADGIDLTHIDLGGGLGIRYRDETPVALADYAAMVRTLFAGRREHLLLEPGRRIVGSAGVLLTRVEYLKPGTTKNFAIVDAAMNDLLRPALYSTRGIRSTPVRPRTRRPERLRGTSSVRYAKAAIFWRTRPVACHWRRGRPAFHRCAAGAYGDGDEFELQRASPRMRGGCRRQKCARMVRAPPRTQSEELFAGEHFCCPEVANPAHRAKSKTNMRSEIRDHRNSCARKSALLHACAKSQHSRFQAPEVGGEILQIGQTWLQCRQQAEVGLSSASRKKLRARSHTATKRSNITVTVTQTGRSQDAWLT